VTQVLKSAKVRLGDLYVPYLYGARSDRQFQLGDSVELELIAGLINDQHYETVSILDPHTYAAINLIHHSRIIRVRDRCPVPPLAGLVVAPDQHADNHIASWVSLSTPHIQCKKTRIESAVVIEVPEHKPSGTYTVIDDICDGGATFIELAKQLHAPNLTLRVTHGVFSKGVDRLVRAGYSRIITTNSLSQFSHAHLTVLDVL
jgi:ribose-phosphate pyrophosphokinase